MISKAFLCVSSKGAMRITKNAPKLVDTNEIAIELKVTLPDALFKRLALSATVEVKNEAVKQIQIPAVTIQNIEQVLKSATGADVKIEVVNAEVTE